MADSYEIRICDNPDCGLRYPLIKGHTFGERCPACLGSTTAILSREISAELIPQREHPKMRFYALLDNVRSAWNVGAIFRTADGLGVQKIYLCGITPTPENSSVDKTALGATLTVDWAYSRNAYETAIRLKNEGTHLWALEQDERAMPVYNRVKADGLPVTLIVGNEVTGVDPGLLDLCERIIYIPMLGRKRSLNVEVAFGVAISALRNAMET